jgi:hypothetical protein
MSNVRILPVTMVALVSLSSMALAQEMDNVYIGDPARYGVDPNVPQTNAVVNQGAGAVKPAGPGQQRHSVGIGGSATSAPRAEPTVTGSTGMPSQRTRHVVRHHRPTEPG